jgi:PmbA protein
MNSDINIIYDMAGKAQKAAELSGADEVEVFGLIASSVNVDIQLDRIDLARESFSRGIGVKAVVNGAVGFSSTNDPARIVDAAKSATSSARVRHSDPDWTGLPQACDYRQDSQYRYRNLHRPVHEDDRWGGIAGWCKTHFRQVHMSGV